jgi:hypothetical protein
VLHRTIGKHSPEPFLNKLCHLVADKGCMIDCRGMRPTGHAGVKAFCVPRWCVKNDGGALCPKLMQKRRRTVGQRLDMFGQVKIWTGRLHKMGPGRRRCETKD